VPAIIDQALFMKQVYRIFFLLITAGITIAAHAQDAAAIAALKYKIKQFEKQGQYLLDTAYFNTINDLGYIYSYSYPDSALTLLSQTAANCNKIGYKKGASAAYIITGDAYQTKGLYEKALENFEKSFELAKKNKWANTIPLVLNRIGIVHLNQGNYTEALAKFYESLKDAEAIGNKALTGAALNNIAIVHYHQGNFAEAENDYKKRLALANEMADSNSMSLAHNGIGESKLQQKDLAAALRHLTIAHNLALQVNDQEMQLTTALSLAEVYYAFDSLQKAIPLFENALELSVIKDNGTAICNALVGLAKARHKQGALKEALANGLQAWQRATAMGQVQLKRDASEIVARIYESMGDGITALQYYRWFKTNSDSLNNLESRRAVANEKASYEFSKKEAAFQRKTSQQRWLIFSAFAGLFSLAVIAWVIGRSRRRLNKTYKHLQHKNAEVETQKAVAEEALHKLKAAQAQLIQAEKMASLGELTSGIAHEIQNPLNFVNNFSEVSNELIDEMNDELNKGDIGEAKIIAADIKQNLEKINHHGKRADAIVKGMLQHSRSSSGIKEPTNINALADEYLRLAYHGLRAKDKSFNATMKTDFDATIGNINIVPQDMGRVILNLITNAFYAVDEKKKASLEKSGFENLTSLYEPTVSVTTKKEGSSVLISVSDNGNGIPQKILDKIFQPFFTTKPTGQGTGLGLSLSYDIVKAHGGELKVETLSAEAAAREGKEGEGATFIIQLPAN
jgi:two-component system, NtrC family, sensor kinase